MHLHFSFQPGRQQSFDACKYFSMLGAEMVDTYAKDPEPRQYLLGQMGHVSQPMRAWGMKKDEGPERLYALLPWVRSVKDAIRAIEREQDGNDVLDGMRTWLDVRHGESTLFLELPKAEHAFTSRESLALTIGIVGGETVFVSASNIMFAKIEHAMFGLSIANTGSYLVERLQGRGSEAVILRKAS